MHKLLEDWAPRVFRFALQLCEDLHVAEDLTQETCLRAWKQRAHLRDAQSAGVWLLRITANLWRDRLRRGRSPVARARPLADDRPSSGAPPDRTASDSEELQRALKAMEELPPRQRQVLYLSACEGLSAAAISEVLDVSADAVKTNLSLARKKMRERLEASRSESDPLRR